MCTAREPRQDPVTGKVRVMYVGRAIISGFYSQPEMPWAFKTPYPSLIVEPLLNVLLIDPVHYSGPMLDGWERMQRMIMPRSYKAMTSELDVALFVGGYWQSLLLPQYRSWLRDGILEEGMGLSCTGVGGIGEPITDLLPVHVIPRKSWEMPAARGSLKWFSHIEIMDHNHELIKSLPWETLTPPMNRFLGFDYAKARPGADTLAVIKQGDIVGDFFVTWDIGTGRVFTIAAEWDAGHGGWSTDTGNIFTDGWFFSNWEYYGDFAINVLLYTAGVKIPQEHELRHLYRMRNEDYWRERYLLMDTINFVEKFGVNSFSLLVQAKENDDRRKQAESLYIDQDFDQALSWIDEVVEENYRLGEKAVRLKAQGLMWVWIIEYLTVAGTSLLTGAIIWTLMVKRRFYHEVGVTRKIF